VMGSPLTHDLEGKTPMIFVTTDGSSPNLNTPKYTPVSSLIHIRDL